ncbi:MAG: glycosyltransferase [Candidatus Shapirobacteria bacterium]|nr:glycosyltransferase [Candidatus Shapirobacteria bacterium]
MKKRTLLLITAICPFPQDSGGATRIKNTIKELSKKFKIYLISFKNPNYQFNNQEKNQLQKWCKKSIFIPLSEQKTLGSFFNVGQPYWFSNWYSPELIAITKSILKQEKIDLIQVEFSQLLYLIDYLIKKNQKKCVFTSHDISTISFFRRLSEVKNLKYKIIHFLRFIEIYLYEKKYLPKYKVINAVSKNDSILLKKYFKPQKVITIPNGIEKIEFLKPIKKQNNSIVLGYIGSFSHPPNKTAFIYFVKKIAPELEKEKINYKYILAGKNDNSEVDKILSKIKPTIKNNINNIGFVDSPKDFFNQIDILITPIFAGSGSRIKILEALGYGKKIISSPVGAEGINITTNLISICHSPKEYTGKIKDFLLKVEKIDIKKEKTHISQLTWEHIFKNY